MVCIILYLLGIKGRAALSDSLNYDSVVKQPLALPGFTNEEIDSSSSKALSKLYNLHINIFSLSSRYGPLSVPHLYQESIKEGILYFIFIIKLENK